MSRRVLPKRTLVLARREPPEIPAVLIDVAAAALLNARGMRRGAPPITNVLEFAPADIVRDAREDADEVLRAIFALPGVVRTP